MKITTEHLAYMKAAIDPHDTAERRATYKAGGLSDRRYRWDLSYAAGLSGWIASTVYQYANDEHIDTALRAIVAPL
jgi:hypothetical protein